MVSHTRVDLRQLLEEIRDAQPGALEETILAGLVTVALEARASTIRIHADPHAATLSILDNGRGMPRKDVRRHHSIKSGKRAVEAATAASGLGFKLALLIADEVMTETRRGATHIAASWHLATRYRAPFKWIAPSGLVASRGTAVRLRLSNPLSPLLDSGYLEEAIRAHFEPLLDPAFDELLCRRYPDGIRFEVDGREIDTRPLTVPSRVTVPIRVGRKRLPSAIAVLERHDVPLPDDRHGIAISTHGKVVRRGWDWLGLAPAAPFRISGLVEAPTLAASLAPGGNDFVRSGPGAWAYAACRKAIQAVVAEQLTAWGDTPGCDDRPRPLKLDRDVERAIELLADRFPLLRTLVEEQSDAQKPLPLHGPWDAALTPADPVARGCRLHVEVASRPDDTELARLANGTLSINDAHPAFVRASRSRSAAYHTAVTVAVTLAPLVAAAREPAFVAQFLACWGGAGRDSFVKRTKRERKPAP